MTRRAGQDAPPQKQAVDFSRSAISRYIQLATLFRRRIESGQWPLGSQIPTVDRLADECGVARATIRQALDLLQGRSEERRVGKECVSTCRYRWSPNH